MYLTPGMLTKTFTWDQKSATLDGRGKPGVSWSPAGQIQGILSDSTAQEKLQYQQMQHNVTHQIASKGAQLANAGDRLTLDGRKFYVQDVQTPGGLDLWTIYMCEERNDL